MGLLRRRHWLGQLGNQHGRLAALGQQPLEQVRQPCLPEPEQGDARALNSVWNSAS